MTHPCGSLSFDERINAFLARAGDARIGSFKRNSSANERLYDRIGKGQPELEGHCVQIGSSRWLVLWPRARGGETDRGGRGRRAKPMLVAWASPRTKIHRRCGASSVR